MNFKINIWYGVLLLVVIVVLSFLLIKNGFEEMNEARDLNEEITYNKGYDDGIKFCGDYIVDSINNFGSVAFELPVNNGNSTLMSTVVLIPK